MKKCIVICTDENYINITEKLIKSIRKYNKEIEILIFHNKELKTKTIETVKYIDITDYIKNCNFVLSNDLTETTYYRCFIPEVCKDYDKVLYLDCDILVRTDINKIFDSDIENVMIGVVPLVLQEKDFNLTIGQLCKRYFNACILLFNIIECIKNNFVQKCIEQINSGKVFEGNDNDIICGICLKNNKVIDNRWCYNNVIFPEEPYIVHFIGKEKPWIEEYKDYTKYSTEWNLI